MFIDDEIEVHFAKKPGPPTSFIWRGVEYRITEIKSVKRMLDFQRDWWRRRHRDYYLVKACPRHSLGQGSGDKSGKDAEETFEIYFHRGYGRRHWVLYKRLE